MNISELVLCNYASTWEARQESVDLDGYNMKLIDKTLGLLGSTGSKNQTNKKIIQIII
jgi:hypothetical protein